MDTHNALTFERVGIVFVYDDLQFTCRSLFQINSIAAETKRERFGVVGAHEKWNRMLDTCIEYLGDTARSLVRSLAFTQQTHAPSSP